MNEVSWDQALFVDHVDIRSSIRPFKTPASVFGSRSFPQRSPLFLGEISGGLRELREVMLTHSHLVPKAELAATSSLPFAATSELLLESERRQMRCGKARKARRNEFDRW